MRSIKQEYFPVVETAVPEQSVANVPNELVCQNRDWTCSLACIQSLLSSVGGKYKDEDEIIAKYNLTPAPYYSKDIKGLGILEGYDVIFGCDIENASVELIYNYLKQGYYLMVECMYNVSHWVVMLGIFSTGDKRDLADKKVLLYDPYYDNVRLENADEFNEMWCDLSNPGVSIVKDFIAVKAL